MQSSADVAARRPNARTVSAMFRDAFVAAVTPKDIAEIAEAMVKEAKKGNFKAAEIVLNRCLGKEEASELVQRLEELEILAENGGLKITEQAGAA